MVPDWHALTQVDQVSFISLKGIWLSLVILTNLHFYCCAYVSEPRHVDTYPWFSLI